MSSSPSTTERAGRPDCAAVILAAGKSTRMKSRLPKPLHPLCGLPLSRHVVEACLAAGVSRTVIVIGHEADAVRAGLGDDLEYALQEQQRGTGDAAKAAESALSGFEGTVLVLAGDVPLLRTETLQRMMDHHRETGAAATLLTAFLDDPTGYGRIVRNADSTVARIVEHKDASPEERAIQEWNPSIYCFQARDFFTALRDVQPNNVQGEYYLTDVIGLFAQSGKRVGAVSTDDPREVLGVNSRVELAEVGRILRERILTELMLSGVTVTDPTSTYVDAGVQVGQDTVLEPQTYLYTGTTIGEECRIGPMTRIADSRIGNGTTIVASQVVDCEIGNEVKIGPFANLRPGCKLADKVKIGDFVELKNAILGEKVSASHLSYIGDAEVGAGSNIGAGVVTCNYDGVRKHRTNIGKNAFVGTNATLVAPVTVGDGAYVAAGSSITEDVPQDALAIARSRPTIKPDWAKRRRETYKKEG
jgi:bifunctional UDP-N-acetylglucosamine pyrophosphorylase / glucosamine-1-phosphate N-acetyltransferase